MTFLYPTLLWLLLPLILLGWYYKEKLILLGHVVILSLLVLALARPIQESSLQTSQVEGKDIIIALDVSYSMHASDLQPSRYDFSKQTIEALLKLNPTDNIRLIAFTSNPLLLSPPTTDHALISVALKSLNLSYILTKGTSLKNLFTTLSSMELKDSTLLLITDGGEESNLPELKTLLDKANLSLSVFATGSKAGVTVKKEDGTLLKDKEGNLVISRINPLLKNLASAMHGSYFTAASTPEATASELDTALRKIKSEKQAIEKMQSQHTERYQIPLLFALLLFLMLHTRAVKVLILLAAFFGLQAQAAFLDDYHLQQGYNAYNNHEYISAKKHFRKIENHSLESQMALANSYYKLGAYKKAILHYQRIKSTKVAIKQQLYYNIANAYAMLQTYDKAKIYYTKSLQLGKESDALHNMALIALRKNKDDASVGIAHPKSQSSQSSKSESQDKENGDETKNQEDQPSSGSGGGGEKSSASQKEKEKQKGKLLLDENAKEEEQPLGSKAYELINKGYIRETQPW